MEKLKVEYIDTAELKPYELSHSRQNIPSAMEWNDQRGRT